MAPPVSAATVFVVQVAVRAIVTVAATSFRIKSTAFAETLFMTG
jgi:hypothetical protein